MRIMFALVSVTVLSLARIVAAQTCMKCDDVHFFLARGNNEPYPGRQGELVAATCDGVSSCGYEDLIYSALYTDLSCQTTYDGAIAGHIQMTAYAERCPDSKLVLAGYSQGGQIAGDILGGGGGESFNGCIQPETPPLDRSTSPGSKSEKTSSHFPANTDPSSRRGDHFRRHPPYRRSALQLRQRLLL